MISVEFDEKSVFTYSVNDLSVQAWDHRDGKWEGPVIGMVGKIKFADENQVYHFMEMLQFMLENINANKIQENK